MDDTAKLRLSAPPETPDRATGSIFFIGTATVLIRYAGFTILTDPNFLHAGDHAHLGHGLTDVEAHYRSGNRDRGLAANRLRRAVALSRRPF